MRHLLGAACGIALLSAGTIGASAETATIGTGVTPSSLDPQLGLLGSDIGYYRHIYDPLFHPDATLQPQPALATGFEIIDDDTWELKLREGIKFHDGTDFDANDVVFTWERLGTVEGSDGLAAETGSPVKEIEVVDPHTIRMHTDGPTPDLITRLTLLSIISDAIDPAATTEDFNTGKAAIGTGPFKLVEWKRGNELVLERNEDYWGEKPEFDRIVLKDMSNDAARVAALQAGDVDMIDYVPPLDAARLSETEGIDVWTTPAGRVIFIQFNTVADQAPMTAAKDGGALEANPFKDNRVRQALNVAISRELIVDRIMEGLAYPANQGVPEGFGGFAEDLADPAYDPDQAKALLAEAGFPDGFKTTLACPNDRYINDAAICQAIGQMWSRIGIDATIETMPKAVYFKKMQGFEFPAFMLGWGNNQGNSISILKSVMGTPDEAAGRGSWNASFADPELDALIDEAAATMDPDQQEALLEDAMSMAIEKNAIVPLHAQPVIAATREGLTYSPMADESTLSRNLRSK
jgi:peptide/nickel transport system substrate-binding protein